MHSSRNRRACGRAATSLAILVAAFLTIPSAAQPKPDAVSKAVGTIKAVQSGSITIAAESGDEVTATLAPTTKILRVPPGEKDLKNATPLQPQDLQPGDRVLIRGQATSDAHSIAALSVIVMKQADVSAQHQRESEDWQKHGIGGLVTSIDAAAITISSGSLGASHNVAIHITKNTILRRYAPASVKFDDARPAPLSDIKPGDQLRARGSRSSDDNDLTADEVVSGSFRNIAGTITATDAASNTITVHDLIAKASVVIKVSPESQMKKLPPEMAQHIATRLKGAANSGQPTNQPTPDSPPPTKDAGAPASAQGKGGAPDVQRVLSHLPNSSLADLQKGEAVMIVSTAADNSGAVTAITLLAGVEPILTAAPNHSASLLSPWSLSTSGGEGDSSP